MGHGSSRHQCTILHLLNLLIIYLSSGIVGSGADIQFKGDTSSSSSDPSTDHSEDLPSTRMPDIFVKLCSDSSSSPPRKRTKPVAAEIGECTIAIEVTSPTTRHRDIVEKWITFAKSGIDYYIILDIAPLGEEGGIPTVIIGSLMYFEGVRRSPTAEPGEYPDLPNTGSHAQYYYKQEFHAHEHIKLRGIPHINWPGHLLTPALLAKPELIKKVVKKKKRANARLESRAQTAEAVNSRLESMARAVEAESSRLKAEIEKMRRSSGAR